MKRILTLAIIATVAFSVSACSNMSKRDKNTAIGAGIGAVGGAILTDGSALGTVGGSGYRWYYWKSS
ncbi:lipoprotein [Providencia rustigianii]|nr:lipoprotein [Providencia rustigianii]